MDFMTLLMEIIMMVSLISQQRQLKINSFLVLLRPNLLLQLHNLLQRLHNLLLKCMHSHSLIYSKLLQPNHSCNSKCLWQLHSNFNQPMHRHHLILDNSTLKIPKQYWMTSTPLSQILILAYDLKCPFIHQRLNKHSLSLLIHSSECKLLHSHSIKLHLSNLY